MVLYLWSIIQVDWTFSISFHRLFISLPKWMPLKVVENSSTLERTQTHTQTWTYAYFCLVHFCLKRLVLTAPELPFFPFIFVDLWKLPLFFVLSLAGIWYYVSRYEWNVENGIKSAICVLVHTYTCTLVYTLLQLSLFPVQSYVTTLCVFGSFRMYI